MNEYPKNKAYICYTLILFFVCMGSISTANAIERSCKAAYVITDFHGRDKYFGGTHKMNDGFFFTATGKCGKTVPNQCRERARLKATSCMDTHWNKRWDSKKTKTAPSECTVREPDAWVNDDYAVKDIKTHLERRICEDSEWKALIIGKDKVEQDPKKKKVPFKVTRKTWGDNKCSGSHVLSGGYGVNAQMCRDAGK